MPQEKARRAILEPVYKIPLSDTDRALLGTLSATWGQMDYMLLVAIASMLRISLRDSETMMEGATTGPRIAVFKKLSSTLKNAEKRKSAAKFCSKSDEILGKRNHITHGIWGLFWQPGAGDGQPACYHSRNKSGLIYASELPAIIDSAVEITNLLIRFNSVGEGDEILKMTNRPLVMGYGNPEGRYLGNRGDVFLDLASLGHSPEK
jgi:hypothetical protein